MNKMGRTILTAALFQGIALAVQAQDVVTPADEEGSTMMPEIDPYNVVWTTQSKNSGESMPVSGGDIGLNVWVENDELLVYLGQAGCRDENGALLKPGRIRLKLAPNPFEGAAFRQELKLSEGHALVTARQPDGNNYKDGFAPTKRSCASITGLTTPRTVLSFKSSSRALRRCVSSS